MILNIGLDQNDTINFRDQDVIGYASNMPEVTYGMGISVNYKNFQLSTTLQGAQNLVYISMDLPPQCLVMDQYLCVPL